MVLKTQFPLYLFTSRVGWEIERGGRKACREWGREYGHTFCAVMRYTTSVARRREIAHNSCSVSYRMDHRSVPLSEITRRLGIYSRCASCKTGNVSAILSTTHIVYSTTHYGRPAGLKQPKARSKIDRIKQLNMLESYNYPLEQGIWGHLQRGDPNGRAGPSVLGHLGGRADTRTAARVCVSVWVAHCVQRANASQNWRQ
jgi:hypothetical protein